MSGEIDYLLGPQVAAAAPAPVRAPGRIVSALARVRPTVVLDVAGLLLLALALGLWLLPVGVGAAGAGCLLLAWRYGPTPTEPRGGVR